MGTFSRYCLILILLFTALVGHAQNLRVTSLTAGAGGLTNNGPATFNSNATFNAGLTVAGPPLLVLRSTNNVGAVGFTLPTGSWQPTNVIVLKGSNWVVGDGWNVESIVGNLITMTNGPKGGAGGTLTDGDKGDITVSASGAIWTIDSAVVTFAKLQDTTQYTIPGRIDPGSGSFTNLGANDIISILETASTKTGSGLLVFQTSPSLLGTVNIATLFATNALTLVGKTNDPGTLKLRDTNHTLAVTIEAGSVMASNLTLIPPTNGPSSTATNISGVYLASGKVQLIWVGDNAGAGGGGAETNWARASDTLTPTITTDTVKVPAALEVTGLASDKKALGLDHSLVMTNEAGRATWSPVMPLLNTRRYSVWIPSSTTPANNGIGESWGSQVSISMSEPTATLPEATTINTAAGVNATNAVGGHLGASGHRVWYPGRARGLIWDCGFWVNSTNAIRAWWGLFNAVISGGPGIGLAGNQPNTRMAAIRFDADSSQNLFFVTGSAGSAWTETDTGIAFTNGVLTHVRLIEDTAAGAWYALINGVSVATNASNIPAGAGMASVAYIITKEAVVKTNSVAYIQGFGGY